LVDIIFNLKPANFYYTKSLENIYGSNIFLKIIQPGRPYNQFLYCSGVTILCKNFNACFLSGVPAALPEDAAHAAQSHATARMAEERARTMAGFNSTADGGARSPSLSPFHGFADQPTYRIPRKEKEVQARSSVADDIRARTAEMVESLRTRGFINTSEPVWCDPPQPPHHEEQFQQHRSDQQQSSNNFQPSGISFSQQPQNQWSDAQNFCSGPSQHAGRFADPDPGFRPQQAHTGFAAAAPLAALRSWFPLLIAMPDAMMATTDLPTLMTLNNSLKPDPRQGGTDPMEVWAAMAAKFSGSLNKPDEEPGVAMARTLAALRENPLTVEAGRDDRSQILHPARFLGGAACAAKKLWREAREVIPLEGYPPLSNYDLTSIGLGGCVTMRGFKEMHNPGSVHNTLKLYSSSNMGSSTGGTRRLTLADNDNTVSIGDNMREVTDLNELKLAVRAMCRTAQLVLPWNMAYNAIDGFLHSSNYAYTELNGRANRAQLLTDFINYVLGLNAAAWVQKEDFLSSGEIKTIWGEWFGSRPASLLAVATTAQGSSGGGRGGGGQGVAGGRGGQGGGRGRGRGRGAPNNNQQSQPGAAAGAAFTTPPPTVNPAGQAAQSQNCRRFNYGNCPNTAATCALPSGTKLHHRCDAVNAHGGICNGNHARINHR
jgi:hypothetical protein